MFYSFMNLWKHFVPPRQQVLWIRPCIWPPIAHAWYRYCNNRK